MDNSNQRYKQLTSYTIEVLSFSIDYLHSYTKSQPSDLCQGKDLIAIICLTGNGDTGKTTSLLKLAGILDTQIDSKLMHDKWLLITYNGKSILIATAGDTKEIVERNCTLCSFIKPDIFVTAIRTPGERMATLNFFSSKIKEPFQYFKVAKKDIGKNRKGEEYENESLSTAEKLKHLINEFC